MKRLTLANDIPVCKKWHLMPEAPASFFAYPINFFKNLLLVVISVGCSMYSHAQMSNEQQPSDYVKTITDRTVKIVNTLGFTDSANYKRTVSEIVNQYFSLNKIQEQNKAATDLIKSQSLSKEDAAEASRKQDEKKSAELLQLHQQFIALIKEHLTDNQVDQVKDGMTYGIFPVTYAAYLDMLPGLTTEQKAQIYNWLKEAREQAMDAESSEKKHAVFGKYKGRINNYLSAAGYDMKKEGEEWQKRIKEREQQKAQ